MKQSAQNISFPYFYVMHFTLAPKRKLTLFIAFILSFGINLKAQDEDPFYRYGFPHEEIVVKIDEAEKSTTKLKLHEVDLQNKYGKFKKMKSLKVLDLQNNKIDSLPLGVYQNPGLQFFKSTGNPIKKVREEAGNWGALKEFVMHKCAVDSLPKAAANWRSLQRLEIQANKSDTFYLNGSIKNYKHLESLLFYQVKTYSFPEGIGELKKMKSMYMIDCGVEKLDSSLYDCESVEVLVLDNNKLRSIEKDILKLDKLKLLSLKNNKIAKLPEFVSKLKNLEMLNLQGNSISPHDIAVLKILMPKTRINY